MKFIEEFMTASFEGLITSCRGILQQAAEKVVSLWWHVFPKDRCPCLGAVRRKADGVGALGHGLGLLLGRSAEDLDDLDELLLIVLTLEEGLSEEHFSKDAADGPCVDGGSVVGAAEDQFRGTVVA